MDKLLPTKVITGPFVNTVIYSNKLELDGEEVDGLADPVNRTIEIDITQPSSRVGLTLVHESLHHYDWLYGLKLKHTQIAGVATCVYDLIFNNPDLVKLILQQTHPKINFGPSAK
jgi:hypothetical protein